ncbi:hypothetical protein DPMN_062830 [Dreissena polymorpha]|uniref:Uncharacterized protein n=1 Tax=Dreissena polymorpha TaxID=45954 RepID=A0A9D4HI32_DREPO|nr:hypothetical protein DPMN_062830 [Dreissena polymorpha]
MDFYGSPRQTPISIKLPWEVRRVIRGRFDRRPSQTPIFNEPQREFDGAPRPFTKNLQWEFDRGIRLQ